MQGTRESGTYRFSLILAATRDETHTYQTLDDMSPVMRATCLKAMESRGAATLIVADPAGRAFIEERFRQQTAERAAPPPRTPRFPLRLALQLLACGAAGLLLWLAATLR